MPRHRSQINFFVSEARYEIHHHTLICGALSIHGKEIHGERVMCPTLDAKLFFACSELGDLALTCHLA